MENTKTQKWRQPWKQRNDGTDENRMWRTVDIKKRQRQNQIEHRNDGNRLKRTKQSKPTDRIHEEPHESKTEP